jgi:hypothetical protein
MTNVDDGGIEGERDRLAPGPTRRTSHASTEAPHVTIAMLRAGVSAYSSWLSDENEQSKTNKEANLVAKVFDAMVKAGSAESF